MDVTVVVGKQGRLVLPAEVRAALGVQPGDRLHLHLSGRQLVVQRPEDAVEELRGLAGAAASGRSLVEELIAERRREASAG
jgi:AbrB family looped-hinge helix DNA binding protein